MNNKKHNKLSILILAGDVWHPQSLLREAFSGHLAEQCSIEWFAGNPENLVSRLSEFDVVVLAKANHLNESSEASWVTASIETALVSYVEAGGGLLVLHSGLAFYGKASAIWQLSGGGFIEHPDFCPVIYTPAEHHPVAKSCGVEEFIDEHYFVDLDDSKAEIFLTSTSSHGEQPAGWARQQGKGRVCVLTPAHHANVLNTEWYQKWLINGLNWCSHSTEVSQRQ